MQGFWVRPLNSWSLLVSDMLRADGCFSDVVAAGSAAQPERWLTSPSTQLYGDIRKPKSSLRGPRNAGNVF